MLGNVQSSNVPSMGAGGANGAGVSNGAGAGNGAGGGGAGGAFPGMAVQVETS